MLCEADVGVTLHPVHIETRYSLRARVLDYFWARLPVLITDGDVTSEWVRQYGLGQVVPPRDVDAVANALKILLERPKSGWAPAFEPVMTAFSWSRLVAPLERYYREGDYAPDRLDRPEPPDELASATLSDLLARARFIRRREGWRAVLHRLWRYIQWRLARP